MRKPGPAHFSGEALWGNDFDEAERTEWFATEESAYLDLYGSKEDYEYGYDGVNMQLGFKHLPPVGNLRVLGLGSAFGDELLPLADRIASAVIVESSPSYSNAHSLPFEVTWRRASPNGDLPLADGEVDLVVCLGVLHHIPNVEHVVREIGRVTRTNGHAIIREPIVSMGDWSQPRRGLTPLERGIPRELLHRFVREGGFSVLREELCFFPGTRVLSKALRRDRFADKWMISFDRWASRATAWNYRYHAAASWQKIRPTSTFLTLQRDDRGRAGD